MKRVGLFLLFVLLFGFVAYAIFRSMSASPSGTDPNAHVDESGIREVSLDGKLTSLGNISIGYGTHLLTKADASTVLLTGLGADLAPHTGKMVHVEGRSNKTPSGKDLVEVLRINDLPDASPSPSTDEASPISPDSWSSYSHVRLGLSFQRKGAWVFSDTQTGIHIDLLPDIILIEKLPLDPKKSVASFTGDETKAKKIVLMSGSVSGYKRLDTASGQVVIVFSRQNALYKLTYTPSEVRVTDSHGNDFLTLVNSLQFLK